MKERQRRGKTCLDCATEGVPGTGSRSTSSADASLAAANRHWSRYSERS
jgi:hypothetical protein